MLRTLFSRSVAPFALVMVLTLALESQALLRVSPAILEAKLDNGRTAGSFVISNTADTDIRVRATPVFFRLSPDGQIRNMPEDSCSIAAWLKVTPREFPLAGKSERQIRYAVIAPDTIPDGSYWGAVEFLPVPSREDSHAARSQLRGIAAILVPVMVEKGTPTYSWSLSADSMYSVATPQGVMLLTMLQNDGTGRIPQIGRYEVKNSTGMVVHSGEISRTNVFPKSSRIMKTVLPREFPAGTYDYEVTYTSEVDGSSRSGSLRFEVPAVLPEPPQSKK